MPPNQGDDLGAALEALLAEQMPSALRRQSQVEMTPAEYMRQRRMYIANKMAGQTRIYLDTNFWIRIRDVQLDRSSSNADQRLSELMFKGRQEERLVAPASDITITEILRQRDPQTRHMSAETIDQLSMGLAVRSFYDRCAIEIENWVGDPSPEGGGSPRSDPRVWTSPIHVLAEDTYAPPHGFPRWVQEKALRTLMDALSRIDFTRAVEALSNIPLELDQPGTLAATLNEVETPDPALDFDQVFRDECAGYWKAIWSKFLDPRSTRPGLIEGSSIRPFDSQTKTAAADSALSALDHGTLGCHLPTMQVASGGYAAIRVQRDRRFKKGDTGDLHHASGALGYCDAFFTERSLSHLLTTPPLSRALSDFTCSIHHETDDVIAYLESLVG